ncbi:MAG: cell wall hydrolase [Oscillospiraceae bacterium]|nr:cell wall hydrolase [Oscillospiraceae bacterium]
MNKAKFAAISMGIFASCLFGGYAVTDAATVRLDESTTNTPNLPETFNATYKTYQAAATSPVETVENHVSAEKQDKNKNVIIGRTVRIDNTSYEEEIPEVPEAPETPAEISAVAPVENYVQAQETAPAVQELETIQETTPNAETPEPQQSTAVTARVFVKSNVSTKTTPETTDVQETQAPTAPQTEAPTELPVSETEQPQTTPETQPAETVKPETTNTTAPKSLTVKVTVPSISAPAVSEVAETTAETTTSTTAETTTTSTTTTTTTTSTSTTTTTTTEPILTTTETTTTISEAEIVDASDFTLDELLSGNFEEMETAQEYAPEVPQEAPVEVATEKVEETEAVIEEVEEISPSLSISNREYILLCNCVAHEAGSDVITIENKAKVVEVVMNRVASSEFPNTIYGVITQKYQFSGSSTYADCTTYTRKVTDNVKAAVDLYFADPSAFNHGYKYFYGDGSQNHFRVS